MAGETENLVVTMTGDTKKFQQEMRLAAFKAKLEAERIKKELAEVEAAQKNMGGGGGPSSQFKGWLGGFMGRSIATGVVQGGAMAAWGAAVGDYLKAVTQGFREALSHAQQFNMALERGAALSKEAQAAFSRMLERPGVFAGEAQSVEERLKILQEGADKARLEEQGLGSRRRAVETQIEGEFGMTETVARHVAKLPFVSSLVGDTYEMKLNELKEQLKDVDDRLAKAKETGRQFQEEMRKVNKQREMKQLADDIRQAQEEGRRLFEEGFQVWERTRRPVERYNIEIEKLTKLLTANAISQDTFNRAAKEAHQNLLDVAMAVDAVHGNISRLDASLAGGAESRTRMFDFLHGFRGEIPRAGRGRTPLGGEVPGAPPSGEEVLRRHWTEQSNRALEEISHNTKVMIEKVIRVADAVI